MHSYIECEAAVSNENDHHTFRVRTDVGLVFMFQVSDKASLERWVNWFKGGSTLPNNSVNKEKGSDNNQQLDQLTTPAKMQSATFGGIDNYSYIRRDGEYSSFYDTNIITTCQHDQSSHIINDSSRSALYQQQQSMISNATNNNGTESMAEHGFIMGSGTSFGVMGEPSRQRYP